MYDIIIFVKILFFLEEYELVFYIIYKLLKLNFKKFKDKYGSLYYLNFFLNFLGEEI